MTNRSFVLDSYALLAFFQAEPGGEKVRDILKMAQSGKAQVLLSVINLGEIYYILARKIGKEAARAFAEDISALPVQHVQAHRARVLEAAEVKADHALSYADAFAVACAQEFSAELVTGDPEFKAVESLVSILWI